MLVLTRRSSEALKVGDDVTITILGISGDRVRIGVSAPRSIPVHRAEIYERIRYELDRKPHWALEDVKEPPHEA